MKFRVKSVICDGDITFYPQVKRNWFLLYEDIIMFAGKPYPRSSINILRIQYNVSALEGMTDGVRSMSDALNIIDKFKERYGKKTKK